MKKFIIYWLLFIYIIDAEALRSIKRDISPPSNIQYIIENYIEDVYRSTEIGIAFVLKQYFRNKLWARGCKQIYQTRIATKMLLKTCFE